MYALQPSGEGSGRFFFLMPLPSAYPSVLTIRPAYFEEEEPEYAGVTMSPEFGDGTRDFNVGAESRIRRFTLRYEVLTAAEAATIRAHVDSARYNPDLGSGYAFDFTTRSGELIANVRYDRGGFRISHSKTWIYAIEVRLIKYP